jgi:DHA1 family bicyclomycin/chloramphenicol resistance-like MFS transporter
MDRRTEIKYLFLIIVVFIAACIETDIYLPAFPDMMAWFSVSESAIQGLLTWNFVGICVSGPLYGPLSDAYGRKKPLMAALAIFLLGSIVALLSQNIDQMLWGRILQGLGSGGCFTLGTAIIFDSFQKERAIAATNALNTIVPLIMAAAPMLGGYLNHTYGFRSNFLAIVLFVLLSFVVCLFFFKETLPVKNRMPMRMRPILKDFKRAFTSLPFWQLTAVTSLLFAGYIAFLSGTSILFVVELGMSKKIFPFIQGAILGGWVLGSLALNRCIAKWGIPKIKRSGIFACIAGAVLLVIATLLAPRDPYFLTLGMVIYAFGANWLIGLYFPESMEILPDIKGIAASLLTSARLFVAAVVVGFSGAIYNATIYPLSAIVLGTVVLLLPILFFYEKRKNGAVTLKS